MRTSGRFAIAFGCIAVVTALGAFGARAQYVEMTSLSCQLRSCTGKPSSICPGVPEMVGLTIDLAGARARGGNLPDWVAARVEPDTVTFSRDVTDASGTDLQSYTVSRASLTMTWRWSEEPSTDPTDAVDATARYQCRIVHPQF